MARPPDQPYGQARKTRPASAPKPSKDLWDKISALTVPFVTLVLGLLGAYATYTYNQADLRQKKDQAAAALSQQTAQAEADRILRAQQQADAKTISDAQTLERLFTFIASEDPQKRAFGYAMYAAMGQGELAARLIELKRDKAGVPLLQSLARDANPQVSAAAAKGLASLENVVSAKGAVLRERSSCKDFAGGGFKVRRTPATTADYAATAREMGVEPAVLAAFMQVEATDSVLPDGRPKILFERSVFSRLTDRQYDASHPDVSGPSGGYKTGAAEYGRLTEAASLNCPAALAATSWGAFGILGSLYKAAGYDYVDDYVRDVMGSGPKELKAAAAALASLHVTDALKLKDWSLVARRYNGVGAIGERYAQRLQAAYQQQLAKAAPAP